MSSPPRSPPKLATSKGRKKEKIPYSVLQARENFFEHRMNHRLNRYYLFNPWTGETIANIEGNLNRAESLWTKPDLFPAESLAQTSVLFPVFYQARFGYGLRKFTGYGDENESRESKEARAALHMTAVARGFLARRRLRDTYARKYFKLLCPETGYYYFVDSATEATSWHKPRLAFPRDIEEKKIKPDEVSAAEEFTSESSSPMSRGPLVTRIGLGKGKIAKYFRPLVIEEHVEPPEPTPIDFEAFPFQVCLLWLEANVPKLSGYAAHRLAVENSDWGALIRLMKDAPDNLLTQLFGFNSMTKMKIHIVNDVIDEDEVDALEYCLLRLSQGHGLKYGCNLMNAVIVALRVLLEVHEARQAFWTPPGDLPHYEVLAFLQGRVELFVKWLPKIPVEYVQQKEGKHSNKMIEVPKPIKKGVEFAEQILLIIGYLAHESDTRDIMAEHAAKAIIQAIELCIDEQQMIVQGFKCLYNFCYMCELGQAIVLEEIQRGDDEPLLIHDVINKVRRGDLSTDYETMYETRRLELALKKDGWRGRVEEQLTIEMKNKGNLPL